MSLIYLKANRTRYRNLLDKEVFEAKRLISDVSEEDGDLGYIKEELAAVDSCINRLTYFCEKLDISSEKLSIANEALDNREEINRWIEEDSDYMTNILICKNKLTDLEKKLKQRELILEKVKPKEPSVGESLDVMCQLQSEMQQLLKLQHDEIKNHQEQQNRQQQLVEHQQMRKQQSVKLPKLELTSFRGDKLKFKEFWDCFETTVDRNETLSRVEKFNYLISKLDGDAKDTIAGLSISNDNYPIAVHMLEKRYGNTQTVVNAHYVELINIPVATNKTVYLRTMYNDLEKHLRSLEALGQNSNQDVFIAMITSKLPKDVLIQLEIQKGAKNEWTVKRLRELLNDYITARERADEQSSYETHSSVLKMSQRPYDYKSNMKRPIMTSSEALFAEPTLQRQGKEYLNSRYLTCRYCGGKHWSDECLKYDTIDARKQRIRGSCFFCLNQGHDSKECRRNKTCFYCRKANQHHRSLCPKQFKTNRGELTNLAEEQLDEDFNQEKQMNANENVLITSGEIVLMQTATSTVENLDHNNVEEIRLMLDSGSQRTYITEELATQLKLELGEVSEISLVLFGSDKPKKIRTPTTKLNIVLKDGNLQTISANVVPKITGTIYRRPIEIKESEQWDYLWKDFVLADTLPTETETSSIQLLIGSDYYLDFILPQKIEIQPGLYMLGSKLGWIIAGRTSETVDELNESNMLILTYGSEIETSTSLTTNVDPSLPRKPDLEDFWNLESIGIVDSPVDTDDDKARVKFNDTLKYQDGRYYVTWPWKEEEPSLPENRELAYGRLKSLVCKMKRDPKLMQNYDDIIREQERKGVIEKITFESYSGIKHYIPHHAVINPTKTTTKVRVVYDASAKTRQEYKCLNECLHRGPVLLHDLSGILLRFRLSKVALVADIEKAFLQIGLQDNDRDATRFFWLKDINEPKLDGNVQVFRFCRVPFGVISSPFLLCATLDHHLKTYENEVAERIRDNIYVDNVITGIDSPTNAKQFYSEAKLMFNQASMNLRDWASNCDEVINNIPVEDRAQNDKMKVLGLTWTIHEDNMTINKTKALLTSTKETKREVLKHVASVYDPLGLFSPVTLRAKLFLQSLWNKKLDWDEHLCIEDIELWHTINSELEDISNYKFPRYIGLEGNVTYQLLCFCDASKYAYATTVYLLQKNEEICKVDLVFSKTRLVGNKTITMPRLELLAVLIGTRSIEFVQKQLHLNISQKYVWSDSQCVLKWINTEKQLSVFVENRISEIKSYTDIMFRYINTAENPADIGSRGLSAYDVSESELWWHGPKWLQQPEESWPSWTFDTVNKQFEHDITAEERKPKIMYEAKLVSGEGPKDNNSYIVTSGAPFEIDSRHFSSVIKLLRVTALVLKFIRKLKKQCNKSDSLSMLSADEIENAELMWIKYIQRQHYGDVYEAIKNNKPSNITSQLGLYLDDKGLLRCRGRLQHAELSEAARNPLLLPKSDNFTYLLIDMIHKRSLHCGVAQTLATVRQKYWIPQGRSTVRTVLNKCSICRRCEGGPYKMPIMPQLPRKRVSESTPYTYTGLDYFGPMFIKTNSETQKVWVCLYTCLVTRAIHLEMIQDMSAEQFLLGFRRFIARCGKPKEITSDNASQFKLASETIKQIWKNVITDTDVTTYVANEGIRWNFIVELAPWMGGFYERLVGVVKRSLRKAIGKVCLTKEQLQTIIEEAEATVNSRPLVYVNEDIESNITLTPSHFLTLNPNIGFPECDNDDNDSDYKPNMSSAEKLLETWKKGQKHVNKFWKIWRDDYLLSLRERTRMNLKLPRVLAHATAKVGDVVLIKDDLPRGSWRIGKINRLVVSGDGEIRSAKVLLPSGNVLGRPLNLLYPIECPAEEVTVNDVADLPVDDKPEMCTRKLPVRKAAIDAKLKIKQQSSDN